MQIDRQWQIARYWSNQVLREIAPIFSGDVINVSGWNDEDKEGNTYKEYFSSANAYFISNHEGTRGAEDNPESDFFLDLTTLTLPDSYFKAFDVVFNHTTLEHIFDAKTAFQNLCQISKDIVIIVVPFAQYLHYNKSYNDYWRFTPHSLRALFQENQYEVIFESANSDKDAAVYLLFVGSRNPQHWQGLLPSWDPLDNLGDWIGYPNLAQRVERNIKWFFRKVNSRLLTLTSRNQSSS